MPSPVVTTLRARFRAHPRRPYLAAIITGCAICFGLGARSLFVQYPSTEWHLAVVRTLSGLGVVVPILLISYLVLRSSVARAEDTSRHLKEVNRVYLSTVETLAAAIDAKDQVRSHHIRRLQNYALSLARVVGVEDEPDLKAIEAAVLLHDMGKLSVPACILNKPGKLTPAEFERVKQHVTVAAQILSQIDFPYPVVPVVRHHHENWDGTGYPDGLKGEAIPMGARVMAVVDCYDALTSDRPYRPALASMEALRIIRGRRGSVYDPRVVDAFVGVISQFEAAERVGGAPSGAPAPSPAAVAGEEGQALGPALSATRMDPGGCWQ